jgi:hypothetical protein
MIFQIPFDQDVIPFMVYIGIIMASIGVLTILLFIDLLKRRNKILLNLFLGICCWFIGSSGFFIGLISWMIKNDRIWIYDSSIPLGYTSIIIAAFFFLLFSVEVFTLQESRKRLILYGYGVYTIILVILFLDFERNEWGTLPPIPDFRLMNLILMILGQLILYSSLITRLTKLKNRIKDEEFLRKINRTMNFFIAFLLCFVFMVISEIHLMLIDNPPPFGPFEYVAWAFGLIGIILGYFSFRTKKSNK